MIETLQQLATHFQQILPQALSLPVLFVILLSLSCILATLLIISRMQLNELRNKLGIIEKEAAAAVKACNQHEIRTAKLDTLLKFERQQTAEKLQLLDDAKRSLRLQFETLAHQIFEDRSSKFSELNREKLDSILQPFNRQLNALKQEITEIYRTDSRERIELKHEILQLRDLNLQLNQEAANLTRALKSDTKMQGNWGELVLERVLERSGLRQGREYETQLTLRDEQDRMFRPDVIIRLPEGRDIVVDSKVSLISWEKYVASESEEQRQHHLSALVRAIRDHISGLSAKDYGALPGIRSLDFVLMFLPIEAAFATVVDRDETLLTAALDHNIVLVTPTTLLATLRTIENLWKIDQQNRNSQEIAHRAALMYDKFRLFIDDMDRLGKQLSTCRVTFDSAFNKLIHGRGNLVAQAEQLRDLGVQVKKEIPAVITEQTESEILN